MRRPIIGIALVIVIGLATSLAIAGPAGPVGSARKDVKEAREELKEARKDGGPAGVASAAENLKAAQQKLVETRVDRRKTHVDEMRTKWKNAVDRADVREAMRVHARREARLHRMKTVATELGKTELVTRIDALITKEQTRFDKKMGELQSKEAK